MLENLTDEQHQEIADILWERLVDAFNGEAIHYAVTYTEEKGFGESIIGSVGSIEDREVCRPNWWRELGGEELINSSSTYNDRQIFGPGVSMDGFDDYWAITHLIENAHEGEQLKTGRIWFGS